MVSLTTASVTDQNNPPTPLLFQNQLMDSFLFPFTVDLRLQIFFLFLDIGWKFYSALNGKLFTVNLALL